MLVIIVNLVLSRPLTLRVSLKYFSMSRIALIAVGLPLSIVSVTRSLDTNAIRQPTLKDKTQNSLKGGQTAVIKC